MASIISGAADFKVIPLDSECLLLAVESPRVCRRLHFLRGWSNEQIKKILPRKSGGDSQQ